MPFIRNTHSAKSSKHYADLIYSFNLDKITPKEALQMYKLQANFENKVSLNFSNAALVNDIKLAKSLSNLCEQIVFNKYKY